MRATRRGTLRSPVAYLFVLPALLIFLLFSIGPTVYTFALSFFKWNKLNPALSTYIGLQNYETVFTGQGDPSFWSTVGISLYFVVGMVVVGTAAGLVIALLLQRGSRLLSAVRTMVFLPHVTPLVATSLVWVWIFNPQFGLANLVVHATGHANIDWLGDSDWAMPAVLVYSLWHELGFVSIVFLGGLTTVSGELSEAAKLDGANAWQEFWYVTFPQLRPVLALVLLVESVTSLQAFTQFFVMTGGGPGYATATLGFQLYQQAFVFSNTGYAAALAVVLFLVTAALSILQLRLQGGGFPSFRSLLLRPRQLRKARTT
ncbi:carbohydrate ABC transporter permease [Gryllotalpicola ginsengisoli]|uniref:carbohydrate ABC transporter permease n=1 Tax=Gryllotalpicola ginsengisoli TaxID=444608 RepID=UPI0003B521DE|nr:sugar ABC transporter permease [Gryllotalpicola ginsengisoli]